MGSGDTRELRSTITCVFCEVVVNSQVSRRRKHSHLSCGRSLVLHSFIYIAMVTKTCAPVDDLLVHTCKVNMTLLHNKRNTNQSLLTLDPQE